MKLIKRGRIWWIDYTANGRRHRQSTGATTKAVAAAFMEQINIARKMPTFSAAVDVLRHFYQEPSEGVLPLSAAWDAYTRVATATGKNTLSKITARKRRRMFERFLEWMGEKRPTLKTVEHVTGPVAAAFAEHLANLGLKTKTRRNSIGELSTIWNLLEKTSANIHNPWLNLMPPDTDGERGKEFSPAQEAAVLAAAKKTGKDWWPVCVIMRHTGLRYGDVAQMQWSEIFPDAIRLTPSKTRRHKISVAIPITAPVAKAIASLTKRGDFLFPMHAEFYGRPGPAAHAGLMFRDVLEAAGLAGKGFTIHSWRHTAASRLAGAGVDIETRKRILGHTVDETARRYDHDEHLAETRAALESAAKA